MANIIEIQFQSQLHIAVVGLSIINQAGSSVPHRNNILLSCLRSAAATWGTTPDFLRVRNGDFSLCGVAGAYGDLPGRSQGNLHARPGNMERYCRFMVPEYVAQSLPFAGTGGAEAEKRYAVACADAVFIASRSACKLSGGERPSRPLLWRRRDCVPFFQR